MASTLAMATMRRLDDVGAGAAVAAAAARAAGVGLLSMCRLGVGELMKLMDFIIGAESGFVKK
jgi:hypothetical protein